MRFWLKSWLLAHTSAYVFYIRLIVLKNWILRIVRFKWLRSEADSKKQYEVVFSKLRNADNIEQGYLGPGAYLNGGGKLDPKLSQFDYEVKYLLGKVIEAIGAEKPATILEIGSGPGLNCMALALTYPNAKITGIDQAESALETARTLLTRPPARLLAPYGKVNGNGFGGRIEYVAGTATKLPFPDKSFDVVFTKLVLEQMGTCWSEALREIRRVCKSQFVVCEMLYDLQRNFWERLHILGNGYPRQTLAGFKAHGFDIIRSERLTDIHKIKNTPCLVVMKPRPE